VFSRNESASMRPEEINTSVALGTANVEEDAISGVDVALAASSLAILAASLRAFRLFA
jgi:hypothetical protein